MSKSETLTIRITPKMRADLEKIADLSRRSKAWHASEALVLYLKHELPIVESIAKAQASARAGNVSPHEEVFARLKTRIDARAKQTKRA